MQTDDWQPGQYLKYEEARTQPTRDLIGRIDLAAPKRILDVGCGPGNSTAALRARWPHAALYGLDSSPNMIERAKEADGDIRWILRDVSDGIADLGQFDVVFSNAALQWMGNHETLIPELFARVAPGGVLAVQVPWVRQLPVYQEILMLMEEDKWKGRMGEVPLYPKHYPFPHYYEILCGLTGAIQAWQTDYIQIMAGHGEIVEWYKGSGLRPFLDMLDGESWKAEFLLDYRERMEKAYPIQKDGKVLFPFTRIFFLAYKGL
ncbi:methyltransferase domain-containing protein [Eubacteriales bacterium OttesenSCG-928-M02]|nr:methyltransferase domain-containing protein [Eubacteriales bacterium OttesenSCG-928-M02]